MKEDRTGKLAELEALNKEIAALHNNCDFLEKNYDVRKTARANEIDALGKAKAVLNGADYGADSFIQISEDPKPEAEAAQEMTKDLE